MSIYAKQEPKWHGWATPDQVSQMVCEMLKYLDQNTPRDVAKGRLLDNCIEYVEKHDIDPITGGKFATL